MQYVLLLKHDSQESLQSKHSPMTAYLCDMHDLHVVVDTSYVKQRL